MPMERGHEWHVQAEMHLCVNIFNFTSTANLTYGTCN